MALAGITLERLMASGGLPTNRTAALRPRESVILRLVSSCRHGKRQPVDPPTLLPEDLVRDLYKDYVSVAFHLLAEQMQQAG